MLSLEACYQKIDSAYYLLSQEGSIINKRTDILFMNLSQLLSKNNKLFPIDDYQTLERRSVFTVRFVGFLGAFSLRERKT
jgi:hypothetical protein